MPRVMAEQGELIVSLFWSWLAGAIYVRKITDGETDRQAYSDKLIQTAFIHWPLLWCVPHLLVLIYRRQLQCGTVPSWEVCVSPQVLVFPLPHKISSFWNFLWEDFLLLAGQFSQDCTGFSSSLPNVSLEGDFEFFSFQKTCLWPDLLANWLKLLAKQFTLACAAVVDLLVLDLSYHSWPLFNCGFPYVLCRQRSLHMQNGQDLGEEPEKQKGKKWMAANP